jgi:hypothetical protein
MRSDVYSRYMWCIIIQNFGQCVDWMVNNLEEFCFTLASNINENLKASID